MEDTYVIKSGYMSGYSSVIFRSIDALINGWFVKNFPLKFFKKVDIMSTNPGMTISNYGRRADLHTPIPRMKINYSIDTDEDNTRAPRPETSRASLLTSTNRDSYPTLFRDGTGVQLGFTYSRAKINFEIEIKVDSFGKQIDLLGYLKKTFRFKAPFMIDNFYYEFPVPANIITMITVVWDIDLASMTGARKLLTRLNASSSYPIILQRNPTTGQISFFYRIQKKRLLVELEDFPTHDSGNQLGKLYNDFTINLSMTAEIDTISQFVLFLPKFVDGTEYSMTTDILEQDEDSVNRNIAAQFDFPSKFKTDDKPESMYRKMGNTYKIPNAEKDYEGVGLNDILEDGFIDLILRMRSKSRGHYRAFLRALSVADHQTETPNSISLKFDDESGQLVVYRTDGGMFDHTKTYNIGLYMNTFLYNAYRLK